MKIDDIKKAITRTVYSKTKIPFYIEWEDKAKRPNFYLQCISTSREFAGVNRELLKASWDIIYFPSSANESRNSEIEETFELVNLAFDHYGKKYFKVLDRAITLKNTTSRIVDNVGHYMFDTELYINYGEHYNYELMKELELNIKEETNE